MSSFKSISVIFILLFFNELKKFSKSSLLSSSIFSQYGDFKNTNLILVKLHFSSKSTGSSINIDLIRLISSIDLAINPRVSLDGEFGKIPDLSKSPYVGL